MQSSDGEAEHRRRNAPRSARVSLISMRAYMLFMSLRKPRAAKKKRVS